MFKFICLQILLITFTVFLSTSVGDSVKGPHRYQQPQQIQQQQQSQQTHEPLKEPEPLGQTKSFWQPPEFQSTKGNQKPQKLRKARQAQRFQQTQQFQQPQRFQQTQQPQRFQQFQQSQQTPLNQFNEAASAPCPERNGRFPVASQCDAYIECIDGVGEEKLCPEGLYFNPDARFNYPCGYPVDINCDGRPNLQPPQPTEDCPHRYGYFKVGDQISCGQFVNCDNGVGHLMNCPEGLAFNSESYRCDWPDQVPDCDAEAYLGFTCPPLTGNNLNYGITRMFRSPTDCQKFYLCVDNKPRLQNCGEGNAFNELTSACDAAENVTGCEHLTFEKNFQTPIKEQPQIDQRLPPVRQANRNRFF